jgi:serine/threonine protein kinase
MNTEDVAAWISSIFPGELGQQYADELREGFVDGDVLNTFKPDGDVLTTDYNIPKKHARVILVKWAKRKKAVLFAADSSAQTKPPTDKAPADAVGQKEEEEDEKVRDHAPGDEQRLGTFEVGQQIDGCYHILRKLEHGAMGLVYEAKDNLSGGQRVAIKAAEDEKHAARMKQECQVLADLQHANILRMYKFVQSGPSGPYLVMEFLDGKNLGRVIEEQPDSLSESNILSAMVGVLRALQKIHKCRHVHRDIKPENIMLKNGWRSERLAEFVTLIDFGFATPLSQKAKVYKSSGTGVPGTPAYMGPLAKEGISDCRNDLWSVGVTMLECALRRLP